MDTHYSAEIKGTAGNYHHVARFDLTRGYLGISEKEGEIWTGNRIVLSPEQVKALLKFLAHR